MIIERIQQETIDGTTICHFSRYFSEETGAMLTTIIETGFENGIFQFIFNFADCPVVNSQGLVVLLTLAVRVTDEYQGKLVMVGLSDLQFQTFRAVSLHQLVDFGKDVPDGLKLIRA
jgi:hypothetical protein